VCVCVCVCVAVCLWCNEDDVCVQGIYGTCMCGVYIHVCVYVACVYTMYEHYLCFVGEW
jgi:hypothetical protein